MARRKSNDGCASIFAGIFMFGLVVYLIANYPGWAIAIGVILVLGFVAKVMQPTKCQVCGNPLKRNVYQWNISGKQQALCSHCNQQMERKNSRNAMKNLDDN